MSSRNLDARELPPNWPGDIVAATETARAIRANVLLKVSIEAGMIQLYTGWDGAYTDTVATNYIKRHLGDRGLEVYRDKRQEIAAEAEHWLTLKDSPVWKLSPLTVAMTLNADLERLYSPAAHMRLMSDALVDAANGSGETNVAISMPPRYGKSQQTVRYGTDFFLANYPGWPSICVCATEELSNDRGREVKTDITLHEGRFGFKLAQDSHASGRFNTTVEGGLAMFAGIFGQIAGRGAAFMTLDDVFKGDIRQISNPTYRDQIFDQWLSVLQSRLQSGAILANVGTRYHSEDLIGLMIKGRGETAPLKIRVICLPALATGDGDELGRVKGQEIPCGPVVVDGYGYSREALEQRRAEFAGGMGKYLPSAAVG